MYLTKSNEDEFIDFLVSRSAETKFEGIIFS